MDNLTVNQGLLIGFHSLDKIIGLAEEEEGSTGDKVLAGFANAAQMLIGQVIDALNTNNEEN